jgi:hypothetical protein
MPQYMQPHVARSSPFLTEVIEAPSQVDNKRQAALGNSGSVAVFEHLN